MYKLKKNELVSNNMDSDDDESYIGVAERKAKQNYLNEEIVDNNFDPQLFMMFCSQTKEPDLDN